MPSAAEKRTFLRREALKLMVNATPQPARGEGTVQIPRSFSQPTETPTNPRELLSGNMPAPLEAGMVAMGETATRGMNRFAMQGIDPQIANTLSPPPDPGITESLRDEFPVATTLGDVGANMSIPGGARVMGGMASGAVGAGLFSEGGTKGDVLAGAAGGGFGSLVFKAVAGGISPFSSAAPLGKRNIKLARQLGIHHLLDTSEITGNQALKNAKASIRSSSFIAETLAENAESRKRIINEQILSTIGESGFGNIRGDKGLITSAKLDSARKRLSSEFQAVADSVRSATRGRPFFSARLADAEDRAALNLSEQSNAIFLRHLEQTRLAIPDRATGAVLLRQRRELNNSVAQLRRSPTGDGVLADILEDVADSVDELLEMNTSTRQLRKIKKARKGWAALMNLREKGVVVDESVNPKALQNVLKRKRPDDYTFFPERQGDNKQFQLAKLQEGLADPFGRPGTAEASGLSAGRAVTDNTLGRAAAAAVLPEHFMTKAYVTNQLVGNKTTDALRVLGSKGFSTDPKERAKQAMRAIPLAFESIFAPNEP